jgi:hypothetical protein
MIRISGLKEEIEQKLHDALRRWSNSGPAAREVTRKNSSTRRSPVANTWRICASGI